MPAAKVAVPAPAPAPAAPRRPSFTESPRWTELRAQVKANWTGLLGAVILVTGVAFFGVLASLYIGPEGRFGVILGFAGLAFGLSFWLKSRPAWQDFSGWLTAISGAIALFACLGAGGIDGLKFIEDPLVGLVVLGLGVALNLGFAYATRQQAIAALHVVLSLCALAVAPAEAPVLLVATVAALCGIGLSFRHRWDLNLWAILVAFAAFHAKWLGDTALTIETARPFAIPCILLVGLAAALVHYKKEYAAARFQHLPCTVHIFNWTSVGLSIVQYSMGSAWAAPALALGAVLAAVLARVARRRGIRWLYVTDTLVSQVVAVFAILALRHLNLAQVDLGLLTFLELTLFHVLCSIEGDEILVRVLYTAQWLAFLAFFFFGLEHLYDVGSSSAPEIAVRILAVAGAIFAQMEVYRRLGTAVDDPAFIFSGKRPATASLLSFIAPLILLIAYAAVYREAYAAPGLILVLAVLFLLRMGAETPTLNRSLFTTLALTHVVFFWRMHDLLPGAPEAMALIGAPLLLLDVGLLFGPLLWSAVDGRYYSRIVVYLTAAQVTSLTYILANPLSDFAPGVAYLVYSLIALELSAFFRRRANPFVQKKQLAEFTLHAGYFFLAMFGGRHVLVHLQSEASIGPVSIRFAIELFALGVVLYWLTYSPSISRVTESKTNRLLTPCLWELFLAFLTFTVVVEAPVVWHPVAWAVLASALFYFARLRHWPARIIYFSWIYLVAAAVHLAFVSSGFASGSDSWYSRSQYVGFLAVAAQALYVVLVYKSDFPESAELPVGLGWLAPVFAFAKKRRNMAVFYPVIVGLGVFLFWRFDKAVLTLLWVVEVFAVFGLGIFVREKHFIRAALAFLAFCIVRLIGYDLSQTNLAVRAGVFVGIGVLMLGINALYRRFKDRIG